MKLRSWFLLLIGFAGVVLARADIAVDGSIVPAFGPAMDSTLDTYRAQLQNHTGEYQNGAVIVGSQETSYPFSLPPFGKKSIFLYHVVTNYGDWSWRIACSPAGSGPDTDVTYRERALYGFDSAAKILTISSNGRLVSRIGSSSSERFRDEGSCLPGNAPDRAIAYAPFAAVILANPDDRRVTTNLANTLMEYALSGGKLILGTNPGGGAFADIAPQVGETRLWGLGKVETLGFDPTGDSAGPRHESLLSIFPTDKGLYATDAGFISDPMNAPNNRGNSSSDPFGAKLPPFARVATLLGIYFIAVVPLNYFLLRKLQKPELTWITAPLLAIVFAGALFNSAKGLYQSTASSATRGTLFVQEGSPQGVFSGASDIFLPKSGTAPLRIENAEYLDDRSRLDQNTAQQSMNSHSMPLPPVAGEVEEGSIVVPAYQSRNLELKELGLVQRVDTKDWFVYRQGKSKDGLTPIFVKNQSPYTVQDAVLHAGDIASASQDLKPGQTMELQTVPTLREKDAPNPPPASAMVAVDHRVLLTGAINDLPVGVLSGKRIKQRTDIELSAFARPELRLPYLELPSTNLNPHANRNPAR